MIQKILRHQHPTTTERYHASLGFELNEMKEALQVLSNRRPELNMAEMEFSVLMRQCLDRRIPDKDTLKHEVTAWESTRNLKSARVDWRFTVEDARIKLKKLYPVILN